jgi:glycosyltransferase involved in cell wall biosynthesis
MKICLIIHSLGIGGMERVMATLANYFVALDNVSVHLILIGRKRNIEYQLSENIKIHKPAFVFNNKLRTIHTIKTIHFIRWKVKAIEPDVVLSFGEIWNNLVLFSLLGVCYPVYVSERCKPGKNIGRLHNFLRRRLYKNAKGIIAQTSQAKKYFQNSLNHKNIEIIGNPIRFIPENTSLSRRNEVLTVGRLIDTKHHDRLIKLFNEIQVGDWVLRIVGGDALNQRIKVMLRDTIKSLNAEEHIILEGNQNNIERYYQQAKVFAFTSSSEGFPNVVGEALSAGLPVVSYDCVAGPADMVENCENGYLIDLFDDESFKEKLKSLILDENLRKKMSENARESIKQYSPDEMSQRFYDFLISDL